MNKNNYAVIMAGGVGSRFWPLSKEDKPKQFLDILGVGETLIQQTFRRLRNLQDCPASSHRGAEHYSDSVSARQVYARSGWLKRKPRERNGSATRWEYRKNTEIKS